MGKLLARAMLVLALLFGLMFAVGTAVLYYLDVPVQYALLFAVAVVLLQYALGPKIIEWIFKIHWVTPEDLGPASAQYLHDLCARKNLRMPRIGIIEDGRPNAFTYGHVPSDARIVVTRGLLQMLPDEEVRAVVAHETGHVCNWDFVVMTVAQTVPLVLYMLYVWTRNRRSEVGMVGLGAYVAYIVSQYLVLLLSRVREYYADRFSAENTGDSLAVSRALVRICYGLAQVPAEEIENGKKKKAVSPVASMGALGIASDKGAGAFAVAATGRDSLISPENVSRAMRWDLNNPWARWFEWNSTHPLTAHRVAALNEVTGGAGEFAIQKGGVPSYWPKFFADLFFGSLPWLGVIGLFVAVAAAFASETGAGIGSAFGIGLLMVGVGWLLRLGFKYRGAEREADVLSLLGENDVSHLRGIPVTMKGTVIGRGIPGLLWSSDLVLQDETGFITLDYHQPFRILEALFGLLKAEDLIGKEVEAHGWYRRCPGPVMELGHLNVLETGKRVTCYHIKTQAFFAGLFVVAGIALTALGMM